MRAGNVPSAGGCSYPQEAVGVPPMSAAISTVAGAASTYVVTQLSLLKRASSLCCGERMSCAQAHFKNCNFVGCGCRGTSI